MYSCLCVSVSHIDFYLTHKKWRRRVSKLMGRYGCFVVAKSALRAVSSSQSRPIGFFVLASTGRIGFQTVSTILFSCVPPFRKEYLGHGDVANTQRYFTSSYFSSKLLTTSKTRENHYHCLPEELVLKSTYAGNFEIFESLFHTLANSSAATLVGSHTLPTHSLSSNICVTNTRCCTRGTREVHQKQQVSL